MKNSPASPVAKRRSSAKSSITTSIDDSKKPISNRGRRIQLDPETHRIEGEAESISVDELQELSLRSIRESVAECLRNGKIFPPRSYQQFLEQVLIIPAGPDRGQPFRIHRQPVIGLWIKAIDSGLWTEYVFCAPSQFGKTLAAFVGVMLYHTCELNENYVLGVPFGDMMSDKWSADIEPVMRASVRLRKFLPQQGVGSKQGKVDDLIRFSHGVLLNPMSAGAKDAGKAGFTSRVLGITEAAAFSDLSESSDEADPLRQLRARQKRFPFNDRRTYIEGTLTTELALPYSLKHTSTSSQILSPCVHCGVWVEPGRSDLGGWEEAETENQAAELAAFHCPACGVSFTDEERVTAVTDSQLVHAGQSIDKNGKITGPDPDTSRLWFHPSAWHNLFTSAADIGREEWKAKQIPEDNDQERESAEKELQQFIWSRPYKPPNVSEDLLLDRRHINARRLNLPQRVLPLDTVTVSIGVDMGLSAKTCWYLVLATRANGSLFIPDYDCFDVEIYDETGKAIRSKEEAMADALVRLFEQFDAGWIQDGCGDRRRLADQVWIDCNYQTKTILDFVRAKVGTERTWLLGSYGRGETQMRGSRSRYALPRKKGNRVREVDPKGLWYVEMMREHKANAVFWDSDTSKWQVQHGLTIAPGQSGAIELYSGIETIHERFAKHITNEKRLIIDGRPRWKRTGANHLLDCLAMARRAADRVTFLRSGGKPPAAATASAEAPKKLTWIERRKARQG